MQILRIAAGLMVCILTISSCSACLGSRLDTTAPEPEREIKGSLNNVPELIVDFSNPASISSAGLRVLLSAQKTMMKQGSMKVVHTFVISLPV